MIAALSNPAQSNCKTTKAHVLRIHLILNTSKTARPELWLLVIITNLGSALICVLLVHKKDQEQSLSLRSGPSPKPRSLVKMLSNLRMISQALLQKPGARPASYQTPLAHSTCSGITIRRTVIAVPLRALLPSCCQVVLVA